MKVHPLAPMLAACARLIAGVRVCGIGCATEARQRVYFANHTSHLDFVVLWASLPAALRALTVPVAGADYWTRGTLRPYVARRVFRAVLVERQPAEASAAAREAAARATVDRIVTALAGGDSLIVFPEGTRGSGAEVQPFKSGLYHVSARRPDVELVPVYLENLNRILPKSEILPVPLLSRVIFGAPIRLRDGESKAEFLARAREELCGLRPASTP